MKIISKIVLVSLLCLAISSQATAGDTLSNVGDKIKIDAQVRVRPEFRKDLTQTVPAVPGSAEEDFSVLLRSRLGFRFDVSDSIGFYIQGQDARDFAEEAAGVPNGAGDDEGFDLHQGFIDFSNMGGSNFSFRLGRQEISLGDQRLVGSVGWSNVGRSLDGGFLTYDGEDWWFGVLGVMQNKAAAGDQTWFGGIYSTWKGFPNGELDLYYLALQDNDGAAGVPAGTGNVQSVHTVGFRVKSTPGNWDLGAEGAGQFGKFGANSIMAFAMHGKLGYTWKDAYWKPRLGVEGNYASGDDNAANKFTRFNNLFPTNHNKYGFMDLAAWSNIIDGVASVSIKPGSWKYSLDYHLLFVDKVADPFGFAGVAGAAGNRKLAGHEADLTIAYTINEYANILAGYSLLVPGGFLKDSGVNNTSHFGYVQATSSF
jgi:hypothetical protein